MKAPLVTLTVAGLATAVHASSGAAQDLLLWRRAAILDGELWRLATGSWVHFSGAHLAANLGVIAIVGAVCEPSERRGVVWLFLLTPPAIGLVLLCGRPDLAAYGGLSGVVCALVAYLAVAGLERPGAWRRLCGALLAGLGAKLAVDFTAAVPSVANLGEIRVEPLGHAAGTACGVLLAGARRLLGESSRTPPIGVQDPGRGSGRRLIAAPR